MPSMKCKYYYFPLTDSPRYGSFLDNSRRMVVFDGVHPAVGDGRAVAVVASRLFHGQNPSPLLWELRARLHRWQ